MMKQNEISLLYFFVYMCESEDLVKSKVMLQAPSQTASTFALNDEELIVNHLSVVCLMYV